ncbi:MAG TPA: hypothetical protein VLC93_10370 [Myxococcota bacterium]|nr:hypothetical protein [Myxococcota bacterium]
MPRPTQRCPHCASPKIEADTCRACGCKVDEVPELPRLDGIETTQLDTRTLTKRQAPATEERIVCGECGVRNPVSRSLCLACGKRL